MEESKKKEKKTASQNTESVTNTYKRLYRSETDQVMGGVCSGIGEYFGIDPVFIRILFVFTFFVFGSGFLLYLALWVLLPSKTELAKQTSEVINSNAQEIANKAKNLTDMNSDKNKLLWGVLLVGIGVYYFFSSVFHFSFRLDWMWAFLFIVIGIVILFKRNN